MISGSMMKAAVLHGVGDLRIDAVALPEPGRGEVRIRVGVCGVCGSDATEFGRGLELAQPPVTLGHEFAGTIDALGEDVDGLSVGAAVVCGAGVSCGECKPCLDGRTNLCRTYSTLGFHHDGGLAEFVIAPSSTVWDASKSGLSMDALGLTQPMGIAVHAVRRSGLRRGQDAVVIGAGGIGAFVIFAAVAVGARVLVVDLNDDRLDLAARLGASATLRSGEMGLGDKLAECGFDADVFFEVSGSAPGLVSILEVAPRGATIVPIGVQRNDVTLSLSQLVTLNERRIVGTVAHVFREDFPEAIRLLALRDDWSDVAGEVVPLDDVAELALQPLLDGKGGQIKTLVDPWISETRPAAYGVGSTAESSSQERRTSTAEA